ncbi:hypothetical protein E2C01_091062 [Portunus trituberculatus]|uniref:Uncharacterized protein n=1 Tax=Portunus trituberculatus TaxID=210409 RepID=A0A5B7JU23_PORTR|nr:hypothetical protein [Portunus trituberculatus]
MNLITAAPDPTLGPSLHRAHQSSDAKLDLGNKASRRRCHCWKP